MMNIPSEAITLEMIRDATTKIVGTRAVFVYLLGSAGTERFHRDSDIDLAVFWENVPTLDETIATKLDLESVFARDVDLVSLNKIDPIFGMQVLQTGRLLYSHSSGLLLQWKADRLSQYADFKMSRRIVEDKILERKKYV